MRVMSSLRSGMVGTSCQQMPARVLTARFDQARLRRKRYRGTTSRLQVDLSDDSAQAGEARARGTTAREATTVTAVLAVGIARQTGLGVRSLTVVAAGVLVACSSSPGTAPGPTSAPAVTLEGDGSPTSTATVKDEVLSDYRAFWEALPKASRLKEGARKRLLAEHLVDPALSRVAQSLASQEAFNKRLYGQNRPRPRLIDLGPSTATIKDCQDSSQAGIVDLKSDDRLTVGVARNPVKATVKLDGDGRWKIATITYPSGDC